MDTGEPNKPRAFQAVDTTAPPGLRRANKEERSALRGRKLLTEGPLKARWVRKGSVFSTSVSKQDVELGPEMTSSGSVKPYNSSAPSILHKSGLLLVLLKACTQHQLIFLALRFRGLQICLTFKRSFWNFCC